ncbi:unnamed protein product [Coregonus sp. 'balchen']|nr:unnamed protein product [Coregonus sp. 'balchen']
MTISFTDEGSESNHHDDQPDFAPLSSTVSDEDSLPQFHPQEEVALGPQTLSATDQDKRDRQPFSCSHCGKDFKMKCLLNKHLRTHSKPYSCLQCGRCFSLKRRLEEHSMTHSGETPFSCADCDAVFRQKPALQSHMKRHKTKKTVACTVCEKKFLGETGLERHKCSSDAQKTFSCSLCPKTFKWRRRLVDHEATHSGERKYCCETCGKLFFTTSTLAVHKRSHIEKDHSCTLCGQCFSDAPALRKHMVVTHPGETKEKYFVCDVCGKCFGRKCHLKSHMTLHGAEKPFSCDVCGKKFSQGANLSRHKRTHTGQKLYCCDVCGKRFTQSGTLKIHKIRHTVTRGVTLHFRKSCGLAQSCSLRQFSHEGSSSESDYQEEDSSLAPLSSLSSEDGWLLEFDPSEDADLDPQAPSGSDPDKQDPGRDGEDLQRGDVANEGPLICSHCGKCFKKKWLTRHLQSYTKPYSCSQCGKGFYLAKQLEEHSIKHLEKTLSCTDWDAMFCHECTLQLHMKGHKTEETVTCTVYEIKFVGKKYLRHSPEKDWLITRKRIEERKYCCGTCGKMFFTAVSLKKHDYL